MTGDKMLRHAHLTAHAAHFVLEEPLQRLAKLEVHLFGQSAHVVVALDDLTRNVQRLDAVRVNGALGKPLRIGNLLGLGIKDFHEVATDNLTLLLGVGDTCQIGKEPFGSIHANDVETQHFIVVHHLLELILAKHTMIHEDAREAVADSLVEQDGCHGTVNAAGKSEDDAVVAQLLLQFGHRGLHEGSCAPVLTAAADIYHKVFQQERSLN